jgi:outer membrane receptor protein involved in Fe transport
MLAKRSLGTKQSFTLIGALLVTSAFTVPAFAQIETVVVTAEKRAEDVQSVPIAISAFDTKSLAAHQIREFKDLQFAVPNVTISNDTFGASNFQIRGIGSGAVTTSGDAGVSVNMNSISLENPGGTITTSSYYDLDTIEVDRGPQGTLYGRTATGGAVNIITAKPNLEDYSADLEGTYGNYDDREVKAMANIPLDPGKLALRVAGFWEDRGGDIKNIYNSLNPGSGLPNSLDSRNDWSTRASLRWQPTDNTTLDILYSHSTEDDTRVRSVVQACSRDPSGVYGCLPDKQAFQPINLDASAAYTGSSDIGPLGGTFAQLYQISGSGPGIANAGATQVVPSDLRTVNTDFQPTNKGRDDFASATLKQTISPWLTMTATLGYDWQDGAAQQATQGTAGDNFNLTPETAIQAGTYAFLTGGGSLPAGTNAVTAFQKIFEILYPLNSQYYVGHEGTLPLSNAIGYGLSGGHIKDYSDHLQAYDQIGGDYTEWTGEVHFESNFSGPFNFSVGASHVAEQNSIQYYVGNTSYDLDSVAVAPLFLNADGLLWGPSIYNSNNKLYNLDSSSVYGEMTYWLSPDVLKFTGGLRYTMDDKLAIQQQATLACFWPIGTPETVITQILSSSAACGANPLDPNSPPAERTLAKEYDSLTGRAVLNWFPKVDFTDATMVYASYSHGNRPGGFNPPPFDPGATPSAFGAENVNAFEAGTKNTMFGGTLMANLTAWYYDYNGYQVSLIINRSSDNVNINSKLWGLEGEFDWVPDDRWAFNLNFGYTQSSIGNSSEIDTRNLTHGADNQTVLKDYTGTNCVLTNGSGPAMDAATFNSLAGLLGAGTLLKDPPSQIASSIAARVEFLNASSSAGSLGGTSLTGLSCSTLGGVLNAMNGFLGTDLSESFGTPTSLKGNQMPDTPPVNVSIGAQYTLPVGAGYTVVPRADFYWKDEMWATIFNAPTDRIKSWDELNAQIQVNSPDNKWYGRIWIKNALNGKNITGSYTGADSQGLFTNLFLEEPQMYGITIGAHF